MPVTRPPGAPVHQEPAVQVNLPGRGGEPGRVAAPIGLERRLPPARRPASPHHRVQPVGPDHQAEPPGSGLLERDRDAGPVLVEPGDRVIEEAPRPRVAAMPRTAPCRTPRSDVSTSETMPSPPNRSAGMRAPSLAPAFTTARPRWSRLSSRDPVEQAHPLDHGAAGRAGRRPGRRGPGARSTTVGLKPRLRSQYASAGPGVMLAPEMRMFSRSITRSVLSTHSP